jgi:hypothetical protein
MALVILVATFSLSVYRSHAQALVVLTAVAKALGDAAASLDKFADGLTKLVKLGDFVGLPISEAKRAHQRLLEMRGRTTQLVIKQMRVFEGDDPGGLTDYIALAKRGASAADLSARWERIGDSLSELMARVAELLRDVESERSGFVTDPAYKEFLQVLQARVSILKRLEQMPAPTTNEEIRELESVRDRYITLIARLDKANDALAEYIKAAERRPS